MARVMKACLRQDIDRNGNIRDDSSIAKIYLSFECNKISQGGFIASETDPAAAVYTGTDIASYPRISQSNKYCIIEATTGGCQSVSNVFNQSTKYLAILLAKRGNGGRFEPGIFVCVCVAGEGLEVSTNSEGNDFGGERFLGKHNVNFSRGQIRCSRKNYGVQEAMLKSGLDKPPHGYRCIACIYDIRD